MKSDFITIELRSLTGQCQPVSDIVMQNLGIERMGICSACGHEISNHHGVYNKEFGYKYVGICCKNILCKPDAIQINPEAGSKFLNSKGNEQIVLSLDDAEKFGNSLFLLRECHDKFGCKWMPTFENNYNGAWYSPISNDFYRNIFFSMVENFKYTGIYSMSIKQFNCIEKLIK